MRTDSLFLMLLLVYPALVGAETYKYTDKNGVVSFTDNLGNVPESQRPTVEKVEVENPSRSTTSSVKDEGRLKKWISHPLSKIIFVLILLIILTSFALHFLGGFFLRLIIKLLIIALLGTMIYSLYITKKWSLPTIEKTIEPYIPGPAPINRAKENVKKFEESQKKKEETLDSLKDSGGNYYNVK